MVDPIRNLNQLGLDMFDPEVIANPHGFYARLREDAPIAWSDQTESWVLSRYDDVRAVLRNPARYSSARGAAEGNEPVLRGRKDIVIENVAVPGTLTMLDADRPDHTRLRKLLSMDFTPNKIGRMGERLDRLCANLLSNVERGDDFEVVKGLAEPLPVTIIAELLGIPAELGVQFKEWSDAATAPVPPTATDAEVADRNTQIVAFRKYLKARIDERRETPQDEQSKLTDAEVLAGVNLLLLAGNETTTNLISNAVLALTRFPERKAALRANPELMDNAIEEFLRYDGSVQFTVRDVKSPVQFHGQAVQLGERVIILLASANRDERIFNHANAVDFHRPKDKHLGFRDWIHICLGQFLARIETKAALTTLLNTMPQFKRAVPESEVLYRPNFNLRGPSYLPIKVA